MSSWKRLIVAAVVLGSLGVAPRAPLVTGTQGLIGHYKGDLIPGTCFGQNVDLWMGGDVPPPVSAPTCPPPAGRPGLPSGNNAVVVIGTTWGPTLVLGHPHGLAGPVSFRIRTSCSNGPCFGTACGPTQILIAGALLATISGVHNGVSSTVPPQAIPNNALLVGLNWACQATVVGGGCADLSSALHGVVGNKF